MSTPDDEVQADLDDEPVVTANGTDDESEASADDFSEDVPVQATDPRETEDSSVEESYYTRPNRYYGAASTWREWTKEERAVADSLRQARNHDLSIHLYNAHALKRHSGGSERTVGKGKAKATVCDEDPDGQKAFVPPRLWTAWPMPPAEVPREQFLPKPWGDGGLRTAVDPRPSAVLQECIMATTTRIARQRWKSRKWAWRGPNSSDPKPESENETVEDVISKPKSTSSRATSPAERVTERQMFSSQMIDDCSDDASEDGQGELEDEDQDPNAINTDAKPVPMVDEDKIGELLGPSTRHIISKVDDLLIGLHKARKAYAEKPLGRADDETTANEQTEEEADKSCRGRRRTSRKRPRDSSAAPENTDATEHSTSSRQARKKQPTGILGLRDWSDVLGMAALTGWDPRVVERASARCASLFGENMLFRRFHEGHPRSFFTEQLATGEEPIHSDAGIGESAEDVIKDEASKIPYATLEKRRCPHVSCSRHVRAFKKASHIERHILAVHAGDDTSPGPSTSGRSQVLDRLANPPQLVCPVESCSRHIKPFSKGGHMYTHVRKFHPALDIDEVKRLEAAKRPERRGRWTDERRHRNPYDRSARTDTEGE